MRGGWHVVREAGSTALVRADFLDAFRRHGLARAADAPPEELAAAAGGRLRPGGRGPVAFLPAGELGEAVLRPYRRGGVPGRFLDRRCFLGDRAFHEALVTEHLRREGVPVAEPLAAVQRALRPGYRAALVTRRVPRAEPLPRILASPPAARAAAGGPEAGRVEDLMGRAGAAVGLLHGAGAWHPDLNAGNLLLDPVGEGPATIVDLDRVRLLPAPLPRPLARRNLQRLHRSLRKAGLEAALDAWPALEATHGATLAAPERASGGAAGGRGSVP